MKTTYSGSCHCGAIQYQAEIDLSKGTSRCNCSWCSKLRYWGIMVQPADFKLLKGADELSDYSKSEAGHHRFCRHCGAQTFGHGDIPEIGGPFYSLNIACLDGLSPQELNDLPRKYIDGRDDNWWNEPAIKAYL